MVNYNLINFIDSNDIRNNRYKIIVIAILLMSIFIISKLMLYILEINRIEQYIDKHDIKENKTIENKLSTTILKQAKDIYSIIGYSNIDEYICMNNYIEIQGKCTNIDILDSITNIDNVINYSIENLKRENEYYIFRVKYEIGWKYEFK